MDPGTEFDPLLMDDVPPPEPIPLTPELLPELPLLLDPMLPVADVADILPELDPVPPDPKSPPEPVPDPPELPPELSDPLPNGPELPPESCTVVPATPLGLVSDDTKPPLNPVSDNPEPFPVLEIELPSGPNPSSGEPMLPPELVDSELIELELPPIAGPVSNELELESITCDPALELPVLP